MDEDDPEDGIFEDAALRVLGVPTDRLRMQETYRAPLNDSLDVIESFRDPALSETQDMPGDFDDEGEFESDFEDGFDGDDDDEDLEDEDFEDEDSDEDFDEDEDEVYGADDSED